MGTRRCSKLSLRGTISSHFHSLQFTPSHSSLEQIESLLSRVKAHLRLQGRFIVDIFKPKLEILQRDPSERHQVAKYENPHGEGTVTVMEQTRYDSATQLMHIKWYYELAEREFVAEWENRILFPKEVDALLKYNGFEIEEKYGDFKESPFTHTSEKQPIVCRKKA
ncbi:MAG: hypothetical protein GWO20_13495 [Candidatus Korarchaeota archaeon]|nr:hypothetical protein [Candidatus Korarchaeota archaeon]NIU84407.1 hypothetical protein [Candidatus Thorarchaeota archaeon]NIW14516.1 hypothetical protein [Candidatus Thorarchaeota archaeon]NIW52595.1 hypothetical protein [Candidatus Korarchaeota archaeon]